MVEILQNKNSSTRFRILVEIAASGPAINQRSISVKMGVTPQAVSNYIRSLVEEEMVISSGRSIYRVSAKGVNWVLKMLRETNDYVSLVTRAITNLTVCAAIAEIDMAAGQAVALKMKDGLLYAGVYGGKGARGIAQSAAIEGQDVDVSAVEGLVELTRGRVVVLEVPSIGKGGSRKADLKRLETKASGCKEIGAIGIEAVVALRRAKIEPRYLYGVTEAAIEAVCCGLTFVVVCTDEAIPELIRRLQEDNLEYEIADLTLKSEM
jgi:putative transcriptional regulator